MSHRSTPDGLAKLAHDERFEAKLRTLAELTPDQRARRLAELDRREIRAEMARRSQRELYAGFDDCDGAEAVDAARGDMLPSERMYGRRA